MPAPARKPARPPAKKPLPLWVSSTAVVVKDRRTSLRWYNDVLGLPTITHGEHWITVGNPRQGGALHLCQASESDPPLPLEPGNTGILLLVKGDFHARCAELKEKGVTFTDGPTQRPWGWDATIRDPDGNELLLMPED